MWWNFHFAWPIDHEATCYPEIARFSQEQAGEGRESLHCAELAVGCAELVETDQSLGIQIRLVDQLFVLYFLADSFQIQRIFLLNMQMHSGRRQKEEKIGKRKLEKTKQYSF